MTAMYSCDWYELFCRYAPANGLEGSDMWEGRSIFCNTLYGSLSCTARAYGTRVYALVYDCCYKTGDDETPLCSITLRPLSRKSLGGIMDDDMCHVKLSNYWCYCSDAMRRLESALAQLCIKPLRLSRCDICCDLQWFACGISAPDLMRGLIDRRFVKVHQPRWNLHGIDSDVRLYVNSMSFGSKASSVFTRFYNKSLELKESGKVYIAERWLQVGFKANTDVYRVEFSMHDCGLNSVDKSTGCILSVDWTQALDPVYICDQFLYYAAYYFDIRKKDSKRKYRCTPLRLFSKPDSIYGAWSNPRYRHSGRTEKVVLHWLQQHMNNITTVEQRKALYSAIYELLNSKNSIRYYEERLKQK